jgi:hypothetical protein
LTQDVSRPGVHREWKPSVRLRRGRVKPPRLRYRAAADDPSPALPAACCSRRNLGRRVLSPATRFVRRHRPPHLVGENASERCEKRPRALAQTRRLNHRPPAWLAQNVTPAPQAFRTRGRPGLAPVACGVSPAAFCAVARAAAVDGIRVIDRPLRLAGTADLQKGTMYLSCSSVSGSSAIFPAESAPPTHTSPDSSADCCNLTWRSPAVSRGTCVRKRPICELLRRVRCETCRRCGLLRAETAQTRPSRTRSRSLPRQKRKRESGGCQRSSLGKTLTAIAEGVAQGHWTRCWPGRSSRQPDRATRAGVTTNAIAPRSARKTGRRVAECCPAKRLLVAASHWLRRSHGCRRAGSAVARPPALLVLRWASCLSRGRRHPGADPRLPLRRHRRGIAHGMLDHRPGAAMSARSADQRPRARLGELA